MKKIIILLIFISAILSGMFFNKNLVTQNVRKGIEFSGGLEILMKVDVQDGATVNINDVASTISRRIDVAGVKNPQIDIESGTDTNGKIIQRVRTTLAGVKNEDSQKIIDLITSQGIITFHDVDDNFLAKGTDFLTAGGASLAYNDGQPIVSLQVKNREKIASMTRSLKDRPIEENLMVIWIDHIKGKDKYKNWKTLRDSGGCILQLTPNDTALCNKVISAATVKKELSGDIIIEGGFTVNEARELASYINSGSIDYKMIVEESNQVNGAFGQSAFQKAINASIVALALVAIFMLATYGILGLFSTIALLIYVFAVLATFNWLGGEYGPDTIAALVIGFGMAIDASIILFERFKDEIFKGRKIISSFKYSNKKSLSSILDANITTFIAAFILFQFGSRTVKGFAIMLIISIFWTLLIIVLVSRFMLTLLITSNKFENKKHWFGIKNKHIPKRFTQVAPYKGLWTKIDFLKPARKLIAISLAFIGSGLILIGTIGFNKTIQFTGGSRIGITTSINAKKQKLTLNEITEIKTIVADHSTNINIEDQIIGQTVKGFYTLTFKTKKDIIQDWPKIKTALRNKYDNYTFTTSTISSAVANDTVKNAFASLIWAIIAIISYVTIRFKWTYAFSAVIALIHDALMVWALFAIFRLPISIPFVSAVLAIIGYSINDTIVTFDRIREEVRAIGVNNLTVERLKMIVNISLRSTTTRSLLTTITTLIAVLTLIFVGPSASLIFNLAMLFGLAAGTYSSIFIASQVWMKLEIFRLKHYKQRSKERLPVIAGEIDENIFPGIND